MWTAPPPNEALPKSELYPLLAAQLQSLVADELDSIANMANCAALLFHSLPDVNWAGFYLLREEQLVLGPFQGLPACVRIPLGRGVCGTAAADRIVLRVADVNQFPGHIACDSASRSEIVFPLYDSEGSVRGVLDIDSPSLDRFDAEDEAGLAEIVRILSSRI